VNTRTGNAAHACSTRPHRTHCLPCDLLLHDDVCPDIVMDASTGTMATMGIDFDVTLARIPCEYASVTSSHRLENATMLADGIFMHQPWCHAHELALPQVDIFDVLGTARINVTEGGQSLMILHHTTAPIWTCDFTPCKLETLLCIDTMQCRQAQFRCDEDTSGHQRRRHEARAWC